VTALALAEAAEQLIGTPFRLHGRDPGHGLDCVGLLGAALKRSGCNAALPIGYSLRIRELGRWLPEPARYGLGPAELPFAAGDVLLLSPSPAQFHLAIADQSGGWIHAHAGLRRVVREAAVPAGTIIHHWRLAPAT
jgi:hypothetical protein